MIIKFDKLLLNNLSLKKMLYQEDIFRFFEFVAHDLRKDNIPILDNLFYDYPGFLTWEEEEKKEKENMENEEEEYYSETF